MQALKSGKAKPLKLKDVGAAFAAGLKRASGWKLGK
jgi:hypothetical protein